ncbi:hypothetical protein LOK49_LG07G01388 [Camellia lanceoleosa]|uniref:Uncharacterized protein n=1 Tax=Camellia lanceoleosa TaxID=1840588 RepID=A0ACC0GY52_9ERIC|nr:hypothetical protein LOK49_LG07G01388 [Camellia lanceoleosa]
MGTESMGQEKVDQLSRNGGQDMVERVLGAKEKSNEWLSASAIKETVGVMGNPNVRESNVVRSILFSADFVLLSPCLCCYCDPSSVGCCSENRRSVYGLMLMSIICCFGCCWVVWAAAADFVVVLL